MAKLRHIALMVPDPDGGEILRRHSTSKIAGRARRGVYVSDGIINVALLKQEGDEKVGIYHFGMSSRAFSSAAASRIPWPWVSARRAWSQNHPASRPGRTSATSARTA